MDAKDWITIISIASTFFIALLTLIINNRREIRQEIQRKKELEHEHQLKLKEKEFEFRYSKLHEKRIQTLAELYERLASVNKQVDSIALFLEIVQSPPVINSFVEKANNEYQDCLLFFSKNRLYFSKELAESIDKVLSEINLFSNNIFVDLNIKDYDTLKHTLAEWQGKRVTIQGILRDIEAEFRGILGSDK